MRNLAAIDAELRLIAAVREVCAEHGAVPSTELLDALLDERNACWEDAVRQAQA
ncbi:hypothetical protein [Mycobacterium sp. HM-7]